MFRGERPKSAVQQSGALFHVQPNGDFVNLTEQQKELLRLLVAKNESNSGAAFNLVQSNSGFGICYPSGDWVTLPYDDIDFHQLRQEGLITLIPIARNQARGKPTERGIALVWNDFAISNDALDLVLRAAEGGFPKANQAGATEPNEDESTRTEAGPAVNGTNPAKSKGKGRKRGPTPDYATAARVAEIVARVAPDGDWRTKLDDILMALDDAKDIPTPKTWAPKHGYRNWYAAAADDTARARHLAIEAIKHHLKLTKEKPTETIL